MSVLTALTSSPAQAANIYDRILRSEEKSSICLSDARGVGGRISLDSCSNRHTRWRIHIVSDSYNNTGNDVWLLESKTYRSRCLVVTGTKAYLGAENSCNINNRNLHNLFEEHRSWRHGEKIVQLKDIRAWENNGLHKCLRNNNNTTTPLDTGTCNAKWWSFWDSDAY